MIVGDCGGGLVYVEYDYWGWICDEGVFLGDEVEIFYSQGFFEVVVFLCEFFLRDGVERVVLIEVFCVVWKIWVEVNVVVDIVKYYF